MSDDEEDYLYYSEDDEEEEDNSSNSDESTDDESTNNEERTTLEIKKYIVGNDRKFSPIMTRFEYARIIGILASMISNKPDFKVDDRVFQLSTKTLTDSLDISEFWVDNRKTIPVPINIERVNLDNTIEIWNPSEVITPKEVENMSLEELNKLY